MDYFAFHQVTGTLGYDQTRAKQYRTARYLFTWQLQTKRAEGYVPMKLVVNLIFTLSENIFVQIMHFISGLFTCKYIEIIEQN